MIRIILAAGRLDIRECVESAIGTDAQMEIVGITQDGMRAVGLARELRPDVIVMGIQLHRLDGLQATKEIMAEMPIPVVLVTHPSDAHMTELSPLALRAGAVALAPAPLQKNRSADQTEITRFLSTIRAMSQVKVVRRWRDRQDPNEPLVGRAVSRSTLPRIVGLAASTGGPAAIQSILTRLPGGFQAPILIVQHMSTGFVNSVAAWLDAAVQLRVKVAEDGEPLRPATAYFAPDGYQLGLASRSRILVANEPPIGGFRPSGTYLFASIARVFGRESLAVILTGMGEDGIAGLRAVRQAGGTVIAQDEASSIVFGMPKAAIDAGLANSVLPLDRIAQEIIARTEGSGSGVLRS